MIRKEKGFTLIELLVVVAIIGILSSVVLASLSSARNKGRDAAIKSALASARAQSEILADNVGGYVNACATSVFSTDPTMAAIATNITNNGGGTPGCSLGGVNNGLIEVHAVLASTGLIWCVDSTGFNGTPAPFAGAGKCQ